MPSISVPSSFFVSERNTIYSDWRAAFWRELLSNAVDAGSSRIMIRTKFDAGQLQIDVIDNGSGMSRDVVENVYMRLGASTKGGSGAIGGFGRARILTCFSQDSYRIRSGDFIVSGSGAEYDIFPAEKPVPGCAISVRMPENEAYYIYRKLEDVLRESSLRCAVMLNLDRCPPQDVYIGDFGDGFAGDIDEKGWSRFKSWSRTGRVFEVLEDEKGPWADLCVNEGAKANKHRAILRVDGMAMYSEYLSVPAQITINLNPLRAREILNASRDSIRGEFRDALQAVYQKVSSERITAFTPKAAEPETHIRRTADTTFKDGFRIQKSSEKRDEMAFDSDGTAEASRMPPHRDPSYREVEHRSEIDAPQSSSNASVTLPGLKFPLVVHLANPTPAQRQAAFRYDGSTWVEQGGEGRNAEMLFAAWTAAVTHVLEKLGQIRPDLFWDENNTWAPGFVFDRDMLACYKEGGSIRNMFLVNPIDDDGAARFKLSDPSSIKKLVSEAIHEVSHLVSGRHDENFASIMTRLVGDIRDKDIEKDIKDGMADMRRWQKARQDVYQLVQEGKAEITQGTSEMCP